MRTLGQNDRQRVLGKTRLDEETPDAGTTPDDSTVTDADENADTVTLLTDRGARVTKHAPPLWTLLHHAPDSMLPDCPNSDVYWLVETPVEHGLARPRTLICATCESEPVTIGTTDDLSEFGDIEHPLVIRA